jgi:hypothetical protein
MAADTEGKAIAEKPKRKAVVWTGKQNTLVVPGISELLLGIEIDATAGAKTYGEFEFGRPGSGLSPIKGFKGELSLRGKQEGDLHSVKVDFKDLDGRAVIARAAKGNVLDSYNKKTGSVTFKDSPYPTEELAAEIYVFKGDQCLTGSHTFNEILDMMKKTKAGINRVLIRLNRSGISIDDCIIDGIAYIKDGKQKIRMGR